MIKILTRPFVWIWALVSLPFKLVFSLVGRLVSFAISLLLFVAIVYVVAVFVGLIPAPDMPFVVVP